MSQDKRDLIRGFQSRYPHVKLHVLPDPQASWVGVEIENRSTTTPKETLVYIFLRNSAGEKPLFVTGPSRTLMGSLIEAELTLLSGHYLSVDHGVDVPTAMEEAVTRHLAEPIREAGWLCGKVGVSPSADGGYGERWIVLSSPGKQVTGRGDKYLEALADALAQAGYQSWL